MLANLLRIVDVSSLRSFLRPSRGSKRPLDERESSSPLPPKRAPVPFSMPIHRPVPLAHPHAAQRVAAPPPPSEPRARKPASPGLGRAPPPSALDLARMRSDDARFSRTALRQPYAPPTLRGTPGLFGLGAGDALTVTRVAPASAAGALGSPATRRLDTAFDVAAASARARAPPARASVLLESSLAGPTRLPSPPAKGAQWRRPAPAASPAGRRYSGSAELRDLSGLPFRELVAASFRAEQRQAQLDSLLRLLAEKARVEEAHAARVDARIALTAAIVERAARLGPPEDDLGGLEAEAASSLSTGEELERAVGELGAAVRLLHERLSAVEAEAAAAAGQPGAGAAGGLAPAAALDAARAHMTQVGKLADDVEESAAEAASTLDAARRAQAALAAARGCADAELWAEAGEAAEIASAKVPELARRAAAVRANLGAAEGALERAERALLRLCGVKLAALDQRAGAAVVAAAERLAAAEAAAPVRRPAGTRQTALLPLTAEEEALVSRTLDHLPPAGQQHEPLATFDGQAVSAKDLSTLRPAKWLNDEVINIYLKLVLARAQRDGAGSGLLSAPLRAHVFQTFFYNKLTDRGYDYAAVRRWTKKFDLFALDAVLVPINESQSHWVLALINLRQKRLEFFDSLGGRGVQVLHDLRQYLQDEHLHKKGCELDLSGWEMVSWSREEVPQQNNGSDCGVFMCQFASTVVRNVAINFTCQDMPYMRRRMVVEILTTELRDDADVDE